MPEYELHLQGNALGKRYSIEKISTRKIGTGQGGHCEGFFQQLTGGSMKLGQVQVSSKLKM